MRNFIVVAMLGAWLSAPAAAQLATADSAAAVSALEQFHHTLQHGDSARAAELLASDAVVVEGGAVETRAEYLGHHLRADIRASRNGTGERVVQRVDVVGDVAWVVSVTTRRAASEATAGSVLAELAVLRRTAAGWRIAVIHWSARRLAS